MRSMVTYSRTPLPLYCRHCGAENPPKAYVCLQCFKELKSKVKIPFWKMRIQLSYPVMGMVLLFFIILSALLRNWMQNINDQITKDLNTVDYTMSYLAQRKEMSQNKDTSSAALNVE